MQMIAHTSATRMASAYQTHTAKIRELLEQLEKETAALCDAFSTTSGYGFRIDLHFRGCHENNTADTRDEIIDSMKRQAWRSLFDKVGIWKVLSDKRASGLRAQLEGKAYGGEAYHDLPEITEDSLMSVLSGMVQSVDEFLGEAIREEYDFWKGGDSSYKTNEECDFKLPAKVIRGYMVSRVYSGWTPNYHRGQHIRALDNIFHALAGEGFPDGYNGPLYDAICASKEGTGETPFFHFKCFKNGNLHLRFLRQDLLDKFNQIAGRNRLAKAS